jgi:hypothetical protein
MPHWRSLLERDSLGAWDLVDAHGRPKDWTLEIVKVTMQKVKSKQQPKGRGKPHIFFKGAEKYLIAGATICEAIEGMYGGDYDKWIGKRITLHQSTTEMTKEKGKPAVTVPCIRVRVTVPKGAAEDIPRQDVDPAMRAIQNEAFGREPGSDDK